MQSFDEVTKSYKFGHIETSQYSIAMMEFIEKKYDIMSFYGTLLLNPGDTILFVRDYISDIRLDVPLYYVIDDIEYPILDKTRLFTFLSPLKAISLRNNTEISQRITFKRWFIKPDIIDILSFITIQEGNICYFYGEAHNEM